MERLGIIMKFLDAEFVQGFIRMADDGWQQGWHERNGGNLSYRVKPEEMLFGSAWDMIGYCAMNFPGMSPKSLLITTTCVFIAKMNSTNSAKTSRTVS